MIDYYTTIIFLNVFAMLILQLCISKSNTLTASQKKLFRWLFNMIIIAALCEWLGNYLQGSGNSTRIIHTVVKAIELSVAPSIAFLFSWIIEKKYEKEILIYLIIHSVIEYLSGIFGFIYYVDKNSNYHHAAFYWIYILAYIISIIYGICIVAHNIKKYQSGGIGFFLLIVTLMLTGIIIQLYDSNIKVDYVTLGLASTMLYVFTLEMIQQTDELTELLNRRGYENCISHIEKNCFIIFFDVDDFKIINDTYGHSFGDTVLKSIGLTIKKHYAKYGKCFRYGGDEFCVIFTDSLEIVDSVNYDFTNTMNQMRKIENRLPHVSIGYSYYNPSKQSIQDVIAEADKMMYQFKATYKTQNEH